MKQSYNNFSKHRCFFDFEKFLEGEEIAAFFDVPMLKSFQLQERFVPDP